MDVRGVAVGVGDQLSQVFEFAGLLEQALAARFATTRWPVGWGVSGRQLG